MSIRPLLALALVAGCQGKDEAPARPTPSTASATPVACAQLVTSAELSDACGATLELHAPAREGQASNVCDREVGPPERKLRVVVMRARDEKAARTMARNAADGDITTATVQPTPGYQVDDATVRVGLLVLSIRSQVRGGGPGLCPPAALRPLVARAAGRLRAGTNGPAPVAPAAPVMRITYRLGDGVSWPGADRDRAIAAAVETIGARLESLGATGTARASGDRIIVELSGATAAAPSLARSVIAPRGHLEIVAAIHDSPAMTAAISSIGDDSVAAAAGVRAKKERWKHEKVTLDDRFLQAPTRAALEDAATRIELEPGHELVLEKTAGGWRTHVVPDEPAIDGTSVRSASVGENSGAGAPSVLVTFDAEATARLEALTAAHRGARLAIVVDDEVIAAPVIYAVIRDGAAAITLGHGQDAEARALAIAFAAGSLPAALVEESVEMVAGESL